MSDTVSGVDSAAPQIRNGRDPHAEPMLRLASAMLRTALLPAGITVLVAVVLATVLTGWSGLFSALIGGAIGFASSLLTIWLMRFSSGMNPAFVMGIALGGYICKMAVLLVVMMLLGGLDSIHRESLAFTMLATIVVWAAAEVVAFRKTRIPTIVSND